MPFQAVFYAKINGGLQLAGYQPQNHAVLATQQVRVDALDAFRRQPDLAAAGGLGSALKHAGCRKAGPRSRLL